MAKSNGEKRRRLFIDIGHSPLRYNRRVYAVNRDLSPASDVETTAAKRRLPQSWQPGTKQRSLQVYL